MGRSRYKISESTFPYFVTCTVVGWQPLFAHPGRASIVFDSLTYLREEQRLTVYAYVLMTNHLHLVAEADNLGRELRIFKSFTARKTIDHLKKCGASDFLSILRWKKGRHKRDRDYQVWQEGSHPKQIDHDEMLYQKIEYIHNNPVKRGYVDEPEDWRYSSARNYHDRPYLLEIDEIL